MNPTAQIISTLLPTTVTREVLWHKGKGQGYYFQSASCCTVWVIRFKKTQLR